MMFIHDLQTISRGYTVHDCAGEVGILVSLDPDLFDQPTVFVTAQTYEGACRKAVAACMAVRNDRPAWRSMWEIAGITREVAA